MLEKNMEVLLSFVSQNGYYSNMDEKKTPQFPEKFYADPYGLDRYVVQEKILFTWMSPNKITRLIPRSEWLQYIFVALLVAAILLVIQEFFLFAVLLAMVFLMYISLQSPAIVQNCQVTTLGIKQEETYYYWPNSSQFWIETVLERRVLHLRVLFPRFKIVRFVILAEDEEKIKTEVAKYLLYKKPKQSRFEKVRDEVVSKLPFAFL